MFDGLKDKLSSFREDAAEEVEEKAAEAEAEAEADERAEAESEDAGAVAETEADTAPAEPDESGAIEEEPDDDDGPTASRFTRAKAFATGKVIIEEEDLQEPLRDLEFALLGSDVEMTVAEEILDTVREKMLGEARAQIETTDQLVTEALHDALLEVISVGQFDFEERIAAADKPVTVVFTGVNGVGKTTTIAKLSEWLEDRGYSSVLANGDTYRAGANEQIGEHADALGRKLIAHDKGGDPAAVIYDGVEYADANDIDVVLGDTAGRLHTSNDLMAQLEKIDRVVEPDLTLFVDESVAGQDAVRRATEFNDAAEIDGVVLSKADADSSGGAAISIAYVTGKPVLFLGTGQEYDDLVQFDPEALVDELLGEE
ncbi:signal recognition particle-docking protein FtsY [Halorarum halophilum]|uniref:Signal recognition particle receptor FtsY n=1 Tax=Halorarum halophilum TaxID=2743090 RepID=A0A7D5KMD2_9EURY|nr:signal recognition particle-docking protein FtsY [Halobaculum halophilum]QLG28235.1 signal recognition particle-docking protein FtsY [Halobaculum halophilum]